MSEKLRPAVSCWKNSGSHAMSFQEF